MRPPIIRRLGRALSWVGSKLDPFEPAPAERLESPVDPERRAADRLESIGRLRMELVQHTSAGHFLAALDVCDELLKLVGPAEAEAILDITVPQLRRRAVPERRGLLQVIR